jgi:hypothetical protein
MVHGGDFHMHMRILDNEIDSISQKSFKSKNFWQKLDLGITKMDGIVFGLQFGEMGLFTNNLFNSNQ